MGECLKCLENLWRYVSRVNSLAGDVDKEWWDLAKGALEKVLESVKEAKDLGCINEVLADTFFGVIEKTKEAIDKRDKKAAVIRVQMLRRGLLEDTIWELNKVCRKELEKE